VDCLNFDKVAIDTCGVALKSIARHLPVFSTLCLKGLALWNRILRERCSGHELRLNSRQPNQAPALERPRASASILELNLAYPAPFER